MRALKVVLLALLAALGSAQSPSCIDTDMSFVVLSDPISRVWPSGIFCRCTPHSPFLTPADRFPFPRAVSGRPTPLGSSCARAVCGRSRSVFRREDAGLAVTGRAPSPIPDSPPRARAVIPVLEAFGVETSRRCATPAGAEMQAPPTGHRAAMSRRSRGAGGAMQENLPGRAGFRRGTTRRSRSGPSRWDCGTRSRTRTCRRHSRSRCRTGTSAPARRSAG